MDIVKVFQKGGIVFWEMERAHILEKPPWAEESISP
jgi:hypothetical protein